jgi:hypothetical protein
METIPHALATIDSKNEKIARRIKKGLKRLKINLNLLFQ